MSVLCWYYDGYLTLKVIVHPLPAVGIAVLLIMPTCMCLEVTILITMSQEVQRMKIIHCSGSFGGTTLLRAAGSRFGQMVTCPQSWLLCQVKHCVFLFLALLSNCLSLVSSLSFWSWTLEFVLGFVQLFYMATTSWCLEELGSPLVKIMEMMSMSVTWSTSDGRYSIVEERSPTGSMDRWPAKSPSPVDSGMHLTHLNSNLFILLRQWLS